MSNMPTESMGVPVFNSTAESMGIPNPDTLEQAIRERNGWIESAAMFYRNEEYYRGLVDQIGEVLGAEAFTADDGVVHDSVLRAKVPELVRARLAFTAAKAS